MNRNPVTSSTEDIYHRIFITNSQEMQVEDSKIATFCSIEKEDFQYE